jgi:catechol 2,3-dioxygenase-like lactoylglutathione lyase family enzyme
MTATATHITGIRTISIPVNDQDAALHFYTDTLGFTLLRDNPTPNGGRWIELAPGAPSPSPKPRSRTDLDRPA